MRNEQLVSCGRDKLRVVSKLDEKTSKIVGVNVLRLRNDQGLSQIAVAKAAGISRSTVAALEGGRYRSVDTTTVLGLAKALGVDPGELLGRPAEEAPSDEIVDEFLSSPWKNAVSPTDEEIRWLRSLPLVFWAGMRATPEAVADVIKVRRQHRQ